MRPFLRSCTRRAASAALMAASVCASEICGGGETVSPVCAPFRSCASSSISSGSDEPSAICALRISNSFRASTASTVVRSPVRYLRRLISWSFISWMSGSGGRPLARRLRLRSSTAFCSFPRRSASSMRFSNEFSLLVMANPLLWGAPGLEPGTTGRGTRVGMPALLSVLSYTPLQDYFWPLFLPLPLPFTGPIWSRPAATSAAFWSILPPFSGA